MIAARFEDEIRQGATHAEGMPHRLSLGRSMSHDDLAREGDYGRIARAIAYLDTHGEEQPSLEALAEEVGLSPFHLQRLFRRWAGVSPKRFLQALTAEKAKAGLLAGASVLDAALDSGLSGPGRLHDLLINLEAMTPGEVKRLGAGLTIRYGFHPSPFGDALLAATERGVCGLLFVRGGDREAALEDLGQRWPGASLVASTEQTESLAHRIFYGAEPSKEPSGATPLHLLVRGSNFQVQVWRALLRIPEGRRTTYGALAGAIGKPGAARAVGSAVGANPIALLIPCHRVIRQTGALGGYRWGLRRKRVLLAWEDARMAQGVSA